MKSILINFGGKTILKYAKTWFIVNNEQKTDEPDFCYENQNP